jgi:hypothetical protein
MPANPSTAAISALAALVRGKNGQVNHRCRGIGKDALPRRANDTSLAVADLCAFCIWVEKVL